MPKRGTVGANLNARQRLARRRRATFDPPPWPFAYLGRYRKRHTRAVAFVQRECMVPSGRGLGHPYQVQAFQRRLLARTLYDDVATRTVVWSLPRGAGKTGLIAALAVFLLYERPGADVIIASTGMRTARLAFDRAVNIIASSDRLADQAVHAASATDPRLELPHRLATLRPLPAEPEHLVGQAPTTVIVDEVGFVTRATYEVLQTALGKHPDVGTLLLGVGTPGLSQVEPDGSPAMMYQLRGAALGVDPPPSLVYLEHSANPDADPSKVATWRQANPALGTFVSPDAVMNDYLTMTASTFAAMRLGLWGSAEGAFVKPEQWDPLAVPGPPPEPGTPIAVGFDGSSARDTTAIVGMSLDPPRLFVLGHWAPPQDQASRLGWRVDRREVRSAIDDTFDRYRVVGLFADPYLWRSELQEWQDQYGADVVQELDTAGAKMTPATDAFLADVEQGRLEHDGDERLRAHVLSAVATVSKRGLSVGKDARRPRAIDLCIAAILAHEAGRLLDVGIPEIY